MSVMFDLYWMGELEIWNDTFSNRYFGKANVSGTTKEYIYLYAHTHTHMYTYIYAHEYT